ncbi:MAG: hypothetical protein ABL936_15375 [Aestuariivirga sp.]
MANTLRFITTTVNMPATVKDMLQGDADKRRVTIGTVMREIIAAPSGVTGINLVATKGKEFTLAELSRETGDPEASCSARFRDLSKPKFGGFNMRKRCGGGGLYLYRMVPS